MRIKLLVGALTLGCAIAVSAVAAYFSVVGLAALFAAAFLPVCIMGTFLEASKLIAAGWLHSNWKNRHVSRLHKAYLVTAILVLMSVTSMGIYGYLMKAHLEQNAPTAAIQVDLDQKQARLDQLTAQRDQLLTQEKAINQTVTGYLGSGKAAGAGKFLNQQKGEQANLEAKINAVNDQITQANVDMAPLKKKVAASGVELGQWKYLAKALGLKDPDAAIDILVKMLMFAFDPMAVVLMISGTITLGEWSRERREHKPELPLLEAMAPEVEDDEPTTIGDLEPFKTFTCRAGQMNVEPAVKETELMPFDPDALIGIQEMKAPTGQIFKMQVPKLVEPGPPNFDDHFDFIPPENVEIENFDMSIPTPETRVEDWLPAETRGTPVETLSDGEDLPDLDDDFKAFLRKFHAKEGPTEESDMDKIAAFVGIDPQEWEDIKQEWVAESETVPNYLTWANAVEEAHTVDPEAVPTEVREPEPDFLPDHGEVALVFHTDDQDIDWIEPEPIEPISLEEAFEREMANEDVRLEEDINRVGDRDILLALLESNPTLLEELVRVMEEVKAETTTDLEEPVDETDPRPPLHWFEAKNPPTSGGKN